MATTQEFHAPTLGAQGEPCASCGAPLAGDQRYCLECGARRAQARLPFREILATGGAAPPTPPAVAAASAHEGPPPARSGLAFLGGLLCLIAALGVGVLIGNSGDDKTAATAPPPQVITVGGAAAAPAATTPAATTSTPDASSTSGDASGSGKSSKDSGSSSAKSSKGSAADKKAVKDLDSSSGSDYQKKSEKLPKEVGTSGKPAPKDNKPAGGGSDFEDIG